MSVRSRFLNVFRSKALERELDDEVRFHLEQRMASNLRRGIESREAESAAHQQFGDVDRVKNEMREVHMMNRKVVGAFALGLTIGVVAAGVMWRARAAPVLAALQTPTFYRLGQEGVSSPVLLHELKPKYTAEAMHAKITGTVAMDCVVQTNGACEDVYVTKPLDPGLDRAAVNAVQAWRFHPGERLGKPVPVLVHVDIAYSLR